MLNRFAHVWAVLDPANSYPTLRLTGSLDSSAAHAPSFTLLLNPVIIPLTWTVQSFLRMPGRPVQTAPDPGLLPSSTTKTKHVPYPDCQVHLWATPPGHIDRFPRIPECCRVPTAQTCLPRSSQPYAIERLYVCPTISLARRIRSLRNSSTAIHCNRRGV